MQMTLATLAALIGLTIATSASAQDCRRCTRKSSVQSCVACNMAAGGYTPAAEKSAVVQQEPTALHRSAEGAEGVTKRPASVGGLFQFPSGGSCLVNDLHGLSLMIVSFAGDVYRDVHFSYGVCAVISHISIRSMRLIMIGHALNPL